MTVEELIAALQRLPQGYPVWMWDRDQYGNPYKNYVSYVVEEDGTVQIG